MKNRMIKNLASVLRIEVYDCEVRVVHILDNNWVLYRATCNSLKEANKIANKWREELNEICLRRSTSRKKRNLD